MLKPESILFLLDEVAAAKKRATELKAHPDLTLAEKLDVWKGADQAAANRFDAVAQGYRELVAHIEAREQAFKEALQRIYIAANPDSEELTDYLVRSRCKVAASSLGIELDPS